ncbi:N-acetyl-gamma-glutamyl-phosphate reductase [Burkholderia pseudomultivorans]|uniref:N-acetyl-gamma-glutamyl-phosphate reductase n=1 Tax=Burkholderia pseudomultivorans TaxID=1207504 RepID=A0ABU2E467_9BURK|nr:N-acetyl-gamma-glutamyl-phosphate reductase [Burkholderia pseudomultivorans]MDR8729646.1 N-acetyl-gamma-glutamyl-phosphate reductase [Burkholderia pseudomultivorans]MDR8737017.1 N-acetyl-gamma-glutamyl-phosphate reductase [Burkholderia pseudomultivorans]MDR8743088.1 N-acetyl-gamma-glutamyl-phosphate reductase [Burkholderia pseudomultivorans]MDR8754463.1 N-acetyl-gamma-glutamyl-phosphate reductase [Burkholderia pseudomultivorans]MDR8779816.1 N-acetyl-gamma-glutamyl-phosphate reductase [Burkh
MSPPVVFIDGDQGTTGLQIHERLRGRTDLRLFTLPAAERKDPRRRAEAINACDIAILCLPDAAAREAVEAIVNPAVRVIDASSAHRTQPGWIYGFPEMAPGQAERIANARRVSNPGCYPTGAVGLMRPLRAAGLISDDYPVSIHAVSGYSGRGRAGVEEHEGQGAVGAPAYQVYGLALDHKHAPEIRQHAGLAQRPMFVPAYGAFRQGIVLTVPLALRMLAPGVDGAALHACLARHYADAAHVRVLPLDESRALTQLDPQALNGTNDMHLSVFANMEHGHVLLSAVFDNLGKGASGAAVQNLELMLAR